MKRLAGTNAGKCWIGTSLAMLFIGEKCCSTCKVFLVKLVGQGWLAGEASMSHFRRLNHIGLTKYRRPDVNLTTSRKCTGVIPTLIVCDAGCEFSLEVWFY